MLFVKTASAQIIFTMYLIINNIGMIINAPVIHLNSTLIVINPTIFRKERVEEVRKWAREEGLGVVFKLAG